MKVSEFICLCGEMGNLELPSRYAADDGRDATQDSRVKRLLLCADGVLQALCCLCGSAQKVEVMPQNGVIDLSEMPLCRVLSLKNAQGEVPYRFSKNALLVDLDQKLFLTYVQLPQKLSWNDLLQLPSPQIGERTLASGTLAEYFLAIGDLAQSYAWREKFETLAHADTEKRSSMHLPVGRWL